MSDDTPLNVTPSGALVQAVVRILRPLVMLLIRNQIAYPFLSELLKSIYLEVAAETAQDNGKRVTDSRLSFITGVHRKDVRRLRQENETIAMPEMRPASLGAQVIATWLSDYADVNGVAKPLFRLPTQGHPNFDSLVDEVSRQDVKGRSLLDEWIKIGLVRLDENDMVHLERNAFLPQGNMEEKAFFFGHNVHDHIAACVSNIQQDKPIFFERCLYYNNLAPESVQILQDYLKTEETALLLRANEQARLLQKQDRGREGAVMRFRYGAYFYAGQNLSRETAKKTASDKRVEE